MKLFANPFALKHAAAKPGAGEIKSSKLRPLVSHVGPGSARTTPRRYDRLADEGYAQNVIAFRAITLVAQAAASLPLVLKRVTRG